MSKFDNNEETEVNRDPEADAVQDSGMELPAEEIDALIHSLKRYLREEFDQESSDLKAKLLLNYIWEEIAPFAYNAGVSDAQAYLRSRVEEVPDTCFRDGLTYWRKH